MKFRSGFNSATWLARSAVIAVVFAVSACSSGGGGDSQPDTTPTSGVPPDNTAPLVASTNPPNQASDFPVNSTISVTFSEPVDARSISGATVMLSGAAGAVDGSLAVQDRTVTFTPQSVLAYQNAYVARVTTGVKDLAGNALPSEHSWSFTTGTAPDVTPPLVSATSPMNSAVGVAVNSTVSATFSEPMEPATLSSATFTLSSSGVPLTGTVAYSGTTATFTPNNELSYITTYTAMISTAARDAAGNALSQIYVWSFTTGAAPDTTTPSVSLVSPANGAMNVAVNASVTATFSEAMSAATLTTASLTLKNKGVPVPGVVSYVGTTATFTPMVSLAYDTTYSATLSTAATDAAGNSLQADYSWAFTTGPAPDTIAPQVTSTNPANAATGVAINSAISAMFSEAMNPATFTTETFTLARQNTSITGAVTYSGATATFTPLAALEYSTTYTAKLSTGAKDAAGNALASDYSWNFTTGPAPDTTPPTVLSTQPVSGGTGTSVNAILVVTFSEVMNTSSVTTSTFTLNGPSGDVTGTVSYSGKQATFTPSAPLAFSTTYTAKVSKSTTDAAGNAMVSDHSWMFTTGSEPDTTAPTVVATNPVGGSIGVTVDHVIEAEFSETMNPSSITTATFTLSSDSGSVSGTVSYAGKIATFMPLGQLAFGTTYTATVTTGAVDLVGNPTGVNFSWSFTTEVVTDVGGIINSNTAWTVANSPYRLTSNVQVAYGSTLTIEPGVKIYGHTGRIRVWGKLSAIGTSQSHVYLTDVNITPEGSPVEPSAVEIAYAEISGGNPYGDGGSGVLLLRDSVIRNTSWQIMLWFRTSDCYVERNIFIGAAGIFAGTSDSKQAFIRNNVFYQQTTGFAVTSWGVFANSKPVVQYNSFLSTDRIALSIYSGIGGFVGDMLATNNYWGTTDKAVIDTMIFDKNDDLGSTNYLIYEPFLTAPDANTPDPVPLIP